ncbi:glycoside hydrolase family 2 protein [Metabacillus halosaccharovorans]|uniref:glycoside hydrolase family 2 protein n=1 Tax=Metabacillus halosaccharovorans TaxID=930124 RepID=UPI00204224D8|nr:sugar-binding domain-containing protein [Metabacillus halosaccharovorans]MCM3440355.1 glycoside hydrolase family 2 [Metabacillus halosaccharovorans]
MTFRQEYPRPQLVRGDWLNLNGEWDFEFDDQNIGLEEKWFKESAEYEQKINVPFAYQTKLSGINDSTFHDWVWYRREFTIPDSMNGKQIILHFGAVDYRAMVFINGNLVGSHEGGHTSFSFDITNYLQDGNQTLVVRVEDPSIDETIPRGKQYWIEKSAAIWYTRTTGIWQTVWIEAVNKTHIKKLRFTSDIDKGDITIDFEVAGDYINKKVEIDITFKDEVIANETIQIYENFVKRSINLYNRKIFRTGFHHVGWNWSPENPNLFDVKIRVKEQEQVLDTISSYFGMRKIHTENGMVYLNNRPYYQKLVLDQGYWPEGLLTAPTDEDLKKDIELTKEMGFNGCRKHQKVEDPRFLYWADKLGFLVWGECAASPSYSEDAVARLTNEWIEIIERDYNHPCIVTWVPINESWGVPSICNNDQQIHHSAAMYHLIHSLDTTRLVISNDGWELTKTDICAIHNYNHGQKDEVEKYNEFRNSLRTTENLLLSRPAGREIYTKGYHHSGEPILLTEFGGIGYKVGYDSGWGYTSVTNEEDFLADYERVMKAVYESSALHGYCYTQLTDVEQEINGLLTYDRKPKCDLQLLKKINDMWHVPIVR